MTTICYYLSAVMTGAGFGTSDAYGHMFIVSGVLLLGAMLGFRHLTREN